MSRFRLVLLTGGMLSFGRAALAQCAVCTLSVAEIPNCAWGPYRSGAEGCDSDGINYCSVWGACGGGFARLAAPIIMQHWRLVAAGSPTREESGVISNSTFDQRVSPTSCGERVRGVSSALSAGE